MAHQEAGLGRMIPLGALVVGHVISQFHRTCLAVIAPEAAQDFGADPAAMGSASAAYFLSFAAGQIPVGIALDLIGPRRTVTAGLVLCILGTLWFAAVGGWAGIIGAEAVIGLGCAPIFMGTAFLISRTWPARQFSTVVGVFIAIGLLGNIGASAPLASLIAWLGWKGALLVVGGINLLAAIAVPLVMPRDAPPPARGWGRNLTDSLLGLRGLLQLPAMRGIFAMCLVSTAAVSSLRGLWGGPYLETALHLEASTRGGVLLIMAMGMLVGTLVYGPLDRVFRSRHMVIGGGSLLTVVAYILLAGDAEPSFWAATALMAAIGLFGSTYGPLIAHGNTLIPREFTGRGTTLMNLFVFCGIGVTQLILGLLLDLLLAQGLVPRDAYRIGFALVAAMLALATLVYWRSAVSQKGVSR